MDPRETFHDTAHDVLTRIIYFWKIGMKDSVDGDRLRTLLRVVRQAAPDDEDWSTGTGVFTVTTTQSWQGTNLYSSRNGVTTSSTLIINSENIASAVGVPLFVIILIVALTYVRRRPRTRPNVTRGVNMTIPSSLPHDRVHVGGPPAYEEAVARPVGSPPPYEEVLDTRECVEARRPSVLAPGPDQVPPPYSQT